MLLTNKVVYGAGGAVGSAAARAFAKEGPDELAAIRSTLISICTRSLAAVCHISGDSRVSHL